MTRLGVRVHIYGRSNSSRAHFLRLCDLRWLLKKVVINVVVSSSSASPPLLRNKETMKEQRSEYKGRGKVPGEVEQPQVNLTWPRRLHRRRSYCWILCNTSFSDAFSNWGGIFAILSLSYAKAWRFAMRGPLPIVVSAFGGAMKTETEAVRSSCVGGVTGRLPNPITLIARCPCI